MELTKFIEEAKTKSKQRKFVQTIDLVINFTGVDFNKPDNRINVDIVMPKGRGKPLKLGIIAGDELVTDARNYTDTVITKKDIEALGKDKKKMKAIANKSEIFLCQAELMPLVGKTMGQILAPRGKMPKPVPGNAKLEPFVKKLEKTISLKMSGKFLPTLHAVIGTEEMSNDDLAENANEVINTIKMKLPNKEANIRSIFIKTSMGSVVKVDLPWQKKKE